MEMFAFGCVWDLQAIHHIWAKLSVCSMIIGRPLGSLAPPPSGSRTRLYLLLTDEPEKRRAQKKKKKRMEKTKKNGYSQVNAAVTSAALVYVVVRGPRTSRTGFGTTELRD
ncbi:hypothetical protein EYF80_037995 [Liparis tanakae]|uniref:Uncharacterized protein n=1 Tax=Liparis tanakae TaxID=230148 RepID=A0A4Z2GE39_9TELE|nr:hypothetical protein EYF80_037995 [Liparis tanakae]